METLVGFLLLISKMFKTRVVFSFLKVRIRIDYVLFPVSHYGSYAEIYLCYAEEKYISMFNCVLK